MSGCTVKGNTAAVSGGGIYKQGGCTGNGELVDYYGKCVLHQTEVVGNTAGTSGGGVYFQKMMEKYSCFVAGTRIAMADGTTKAIEDVVEGDVVKTFDHEGGTNSTARVFIWLKEAVTTRAFTLAFAGGYSVTCVLTHDFLMKDGENACKYVCLGRANAADYIGKLFYGIDGQWHELQSVIDGEVVSEIYELYTAQHFNSYANGLLTVPADVEANLNFYKLDANLKADAAQLTADVAKYGYYTYEEAAARGVSRAYYEDSGTKYVNVIVGKGLATWEELENIYASVSRGGIPASPERKVASSSVVRQDAAPTMAALPALAAVNAEPTLDNYTAGWLTLGVGVVVTNNIANGAKGNIYLATADSGADSLVKLDLTHTGIIAGVACEWGAGQFTTADNVTSSDTQYFTSDNAAYVVKFVTDHLELVEGCAVVVSADGATTNAYVTLAEAFENVGNNETILLLRDNSEVITVEITATQFTFDANGYSLAGGSVQAAAGYKFFPVAGTTTCLYAKDVKDVPTVMEEETEVKPVEKPAETSEKAWDAVTNISASVTVENSSALVADSVVSNAVDDAKQIAEQQGGDLKMLVNDVTIEVESRGAETNALNEVYKAVFDVTPYLTVSAVIVTSGGKTNTPTVVEKTDDFTYSGQAVPVSFCVASLGGAPMLITHDHAGETYTHVLGDVPSLTEFSYDEEKMTVTLMADRFCEFAAHKAIPVGDDAKAIVDKDGNCTIVGTGPTWNRKAWGGDIALWDAYRKTIRSVVVSNGVTGVGQALLYKFYAVTNVTLSADVASVGDYAFYNCHSLERITYEGSTAPSMTSKAIMFSAAIRMEGFTPVVYTIPDIESFHPTLKGKKELTDPDWTTIDSPSAMGEYRFFKVELNN